MAQENASFQDRVDARNEAISGSLGFDFTSRNYFRGIVQEDRGVIAQPWINIGFNLHEGGRTMRNLNLVLGQWNSLHSDQTNTGGGVWYESRVHVGLEAQFGERWHTGLHYRTYAFPNNGARPVQELTISARFDDVGVVSDNFSLQPTVTIAKEIVGQRDGGADKGIYAGISVSPNWVIGQLGDNDVTLTLPATIGLSLGDYYERAGGGGDDFLGFAQAGGVLSAPLEFMPARLGPWTGHFGVHLILLGDNNQNRNTGDDGDVIFEFGMSTEF